MPEKEEILTLIDEEGEQFDFLVLDYFNMEEQEYAVLLPVDEEEFTDSDEDDVVDEPDFEGGEKEDEEEEGEAIIFRVVKGNNGENTLQTIEDEEEWKKVAEEAYERLLAAEEKE